MPTPMVSATAARAARLVEELNMMEEERVVESAGLADEPSVLYLRGVVIDPGLKCL